MGVNLLGLRKSKAKDGGLGKNGRQELAYPCSVTLVGGTQAAI